MNVLSLCGPESGLPKNPSVSNHEDLCKGFKKILEVLIHEETEIILSPYLPFLNGVD